MMNKTMVSVVMITYGHDQFIGQAIEGVLMQKCDFDIELLIANDCSPDNTDEVVQKIIQDHPNANWIKYTKHKENKGMMPNFIWALQQAEGKYIALCEGDDYWIDPLKLQKQVLVMKDNPNCNIVYHNCMKIDGFGNQIELVYDLNYNKELTITNLLKGDYTKTCTLLIRNGFHSLSSEFLDDTLFTMNLLEQGSKAIYIPEVLSIYRIHPGGIWSMKSAYDRFRQSEFVEKYIHNRYNSTFPKLVLERYRNYYFNESINLVTSKFYRLSFYCFLKYLRKEFSAKNSLRYFKWFILSVVKK